MKLYRISQTKNNGYDTYDTAVVVAETEEAARVVKPSAFPFDAGDWAPPEFVTVEYLGEAREGLTAGVVVASFHAG